MTPWPPGRRDRARLTHGDPGLQPERTTLAWDRTTLALAAVGLLFLRLSNVLGPTAVIPLALSAVVVAAVHAQRSRRLERATAGIVGERGRADVVSVLLLTAGTLGMAIAGVVVLALAS